MSRVIETIILGGLFALFYLEVVATYGLWYAGGLACLFFPVFVGGLLLGAYFDEHWVIMI